jgi:hypothetical protein
MFKKTYSALYGSLLTLLFLVFGFLILPTNVVAETARFWMSNNGSDIYYNGGRVGVGVSNPSEEIHLFQDSPVTVGILMGNSYTGNGRDGFMVNYHWSGAGAELWNFEDTDMWFGTNNTRRLTIKNTGTVDLHNNNLKSANQIQIQDPGVDEGIIWGETEAKIYVSPLDGQGNTDGYLRLINDGGIVFEPGGENMEAMTLAASGNVGIGTIAPTERLDIAGNVKIGSGNAIVLPTRFSSPNFTAHQIRMTDAQSGIEIESGANVKIAIDRDSDEDDDAFLVTYGANEIPALRVEWNGNVGVGAAVPNSALEISDGYIELATSKGVPPAQDCNAANEVGRMKMDATSMALYVCSARGWVVK